LPVDAGIEGYSGIDHRWASSLIVSVRLKDTIPEREQYHRSIKSIITIHYDQTVGMIPVKTGRFRLVHSLFSRFVKGVNYCCGIAACTESSGAANVTFPGPIELIFTRSG
ncbi:MAG: hypothetical protein KDA74_07215, partial [Planctomycetaceae bacterium]|nr:hypothetical protein [Planctomycetaceae bacterium]